ncbi:MAG: hypothetical protein SFX73_25420 [Kofleriaceae bacterium]|nr:hypothetical protein [Kofleriaceae bacterium]
MNTLGIPQHIYDALPNVADVFAGRKTDDGGSQIRIATHRARRDGAADNHDPHAREREARKKMINDGATAYLKRGDEHDDEKPAPQAPQAPTSRATAPTTAQAVNSPSPREVAARAELLRSSANAYKTKQER